MVSPPTINGITTSNDETLSMNSPREKASIKTVEDSVNSNSRVNETSEISQPKIEEKKNDTKRPDSPTSSLASTISTRRAEAILEAQQVLHSAGYAESSLDDFNLLGIVMNPFGPGSHPAVSTSYIPISSNVQQEKTESNPYDLSTLTATVDNLTNMLNGFNTAVLQTTGTNSGLPDDHIEHTLEDALAEEITSQLPSCPDKYMVDTTSLQRFFHSKTGAMAEKFVARGHEMEHFYSNQANETYDDYINEKDVNVMETIPPIYFSPYFDLTNPQTFEELLIKDPQKDPKQHYETLTSFLDAVEIRLLHQVKYKSERFFQETDNFTLLKSWIAECLDDVHILRNQLESIMKHTVSSSSNIPKLASTRSNYDSLRVVLNQVDTVLEAKRSVSGLLHANDYTTALDVIHTSKLNIQQHLKNLKCMDNVSSQLTEYETLIVEKLCTDLSQLLFDYTDSKYAYDQVRKQKQQITQIIVNLRSCDKLSQANLLYTQRLCDLIKVMFKTTVGECADEKKEQNQQPTISEAVISMTFEQFTSCLEILMEQITSVLLTSSSVETFFKEEGFDDFFTSVVDTNNKTTKSNIITPFASALDLAQKSFVELLRLRKDAHSLLSLDDIKRLWDLCMGFCSSLEKCSNVTNTGSSLGYGIKSTLLVQVKAFLERKHECDLSQLVGSLDCEKWVQVDVSAERQAALTKLCTGRALLSTSSSKTKGPTTKNTSSTTYAEVEGTQYKVVWSCLLLIEKVISNLSCAAYFQSLSTTLIPKIAELLRLFNTRTQSLVLGAGAIHSSARLKSINAKHLALVTQCLELVITLIPHVRAGLMSLLPNKNQHVLLEEIDKTQKDMMEHNERVLSKFVSIIGGIVEHGLAPKISKTNFDVTAASKDKVVLCPFMEGIAINTKKMHQVLSALLPEEHLQDVFCRIYAYIDHKIPMLYISTAEANEPTLNADNRTQKSSFGLPLTIAGKKRMLYEIEMLTTGLNKLPGVRPWDFTMTKVLERKLDIEVVEKKDDVGASKDEEDKEENSENGVKQTEV